MQTIFSPLPKFESLGAHEISAPKLRNRGRNVPVLGRDLLELTLQSFPTLYNGTLIRNNRSEAASDRSFVEIDFGFFPADFFDTPLDLNLALEPWPMKVQSRTRIFGQIARFPALVVGEKYESPLAKALQKNNAGGRRTLLGCRGQRHCIRLTIPGGSNGFIKPLLKLQKRIGIKFISV